MTRPRLIRLNEGDDRPGLWVNPAAITGARVKGERGPNRLAVQGPN